MLITHSYLGTVGGPYRYLFYLLLEDYIQEQNGLLRGYLERFARQLKDQGVLIRPFLGDIDRTKQEILGKAWPSDEEIMRTPSLLMIDRSFSDFDPRQHPWIHVLLGDREVQRSDDILQNIADLITDISKANENIFEKVSTILSEEVSVSDISKVFEAKPGIFGFSIDLMKARELFKRIRLQTPGSYRSQ